MSGVAETAPLTESDRAKLVARYMANCLKLQSEKSSGPQVDRLHMLYCECLSRRIVGSIEQTLTAEDMIDMGKHKEQSAAFAKLAPLMSQHSKNCGAELPK
jgi:hypothetical protein